MIHRNRLVLPNTFSDLGAGIVTVSRDDLLNRLAEKGLHYSSDADAGSGVSVPWRRGREAIAAWRVIVSLPCLDAKNPEGVSIETLTLSGFPTR
jgi:hypothetical protein